MNNKMLRRTRNAKQGNNLPTKKEQNDEFNFNFTQTYSSSHFNYYSYGYILSENEDEKMLNNLLKLFAVCIERSNETKNDADRNNQAMNTYMRISLSYGTDGYNTCTQNERNNRNVEQFLINLVDTNGKYFTEEEGKKLDEKLNAEEFSYLNVLEEINNLEENNNAKKTNSFHILLATGNEEKTIEAKTKILLELKKYKNIKVICIEDCAYAELFYYCNSNMERLIKKDKVMDMKI